MEDLYLTACKIVRNDRKWKFQGRVTYLTGGHHHATTDGVEWVRGNTGSSGNRPSESERGQEVTLEVTGEKDRLEGVVETEVETTVDDDTSDGRHETTVKTSNTVRSESLLVDIDQSVELTLTTLLCGLGVVGKTGTGVVEGVDKEEGSGTSSLRMSVLVVFGKDCLTYTTGGKVTSHPPPVSVTLLLVTEH